MTINTKNNKNRLVNKWTKRKKEEKKKERKNIYTRKNTVISRTTAERTKHSPLTRKTTRNSMVSSRPLVSNTSCWRTCYQRSVSWYPSRRPYLWGVPMLTVQCCHIPVYFPDHFFVSISVYKSYCNYRDLVQYRALETEREKKTEIRKQLQTKGRRGEKKTLATLFYSSDHASGNVSTQR